jgi:hypothetical protein
LIFFFAKKGEELTIDYGLEWWMAKSHLNCRCASAKCKYTGRQGADVRLEMADAHNENINDGNPVYKAIVCVTENGERAFIRLSDF